MNIESRPITAVGWAMLHRADGDTDTLARLLGYFRDPAAHDGSERWEFMRLAESNAWKAVELLLLRSMIERRFSEGKLDAWVQTTPLGEEIRDSLSSFFDSHRSVEFPSEPPSFGPLAFQELRAARLAGELCAEQRNPAASNAEDIMERLATRLADRFPLLAQAIRQPNLDMPGMTWFILDCRIRYNFETLVALPSRTPPPNPGLEDLVVLLINAPSRIDELLGDIYADCEFIRRVKVAEMRKTIRDKSDDDLKREARDEVEAMLGRAIPIRARTLAEAVAEAEKIKATENIMVAQSSLWAWYNGLPTKEREDIGQFENKIRLWLTARFRNRPQ